VREGALAAGKHLEDLCDLLRRDADAAVTNPMPPPWRARAREPLLESRPLLLPEVHGQNSGQREDRQRSGQKQDDEVGPQPYAARMILRMR
jgi:hypothetical protein